MQLRTKTLVVYSFTLFLLVLTLYLSAGSIVFNSFEELETNAVHDDMGKALDFIDQTEMHLNLLSQSWATSHDTVEFVQTNNSGYIETHLANANLQANYVNVIIFMDDSGEIVYKKAYDMYKQEELDFPEDLAIILSEDNTIIPSSEINYESSGIILVSNTPLIFSSKPIKETAASTDSYGTLIIGTFFNSDSIAFFEDIHKRPLKYYLFNDPSVNSETKNIMLEVENSDENIFLKTVNANSIKGYTIIDDVYGQPAMMLETESPRIISQKAQTTFAYLIYVIIFAGFLYGAAGTLFLENSILSRLSSLTKDVDSIKKDSSQTPIITVQGPNDEISSLGSSISHLLERIEERESLLYSIIESISESVIVIDENYRMTHFKSNFIDLWGIPEDIIKEKDGMKLLSHLKGKMVNFDEILAKLQKYHMTRESNVTMVQFTDGTYFEVLSFPLIQKGEVIGRILSFKDVTEQKKSEELLKEKEHRYRSLFEHSGDAIFLVQDGIIQDMNDKACGALCRSDDKLIGTPLIESIPEENRQVAEKLIADSLVDSYSKVEVKFKKPDGSTMFAEVTANLVDEESGLVQLILRDITERKEIERLEQENSERMSLILDNINSGVIVIDAKTHEIVDINPTALEIIDRTKEDVLGNICHKFVCPSEKGRCPISDLHQTIDKSERVVVRSDGTRVPVLKTVEPVRFGTRELFIESFIDISR
ncbi:MAG: PAS domain S-box protein [Methanolobus sp.]